MGQNNSPMCKQWIICCNRQENKDEVEDFVCDSLNTQVICFFAFCVCIVSICFSLEEIDAKNLHNFVLSHKNVFFITQLCDLVFSLKAAAL